MNLGDWTCVGCNEVNFKKRDKCRKCHKPKYTKRNGDWNCSCGELNFANRTHCRKCNKLSTTPNSATPNVNQNVPIKFGDWICTSAGCGEHNFKHRNLCRKCNKPKTINNESTESEEKICVICMNSPQTHAITKCGHLCYCEVCGFALNKCPMCRMDYNPDTDLLKIFGV